MAWETADVDITIAETGILYRNPIPHVRSIHAYFPSVARLPDGTLAATVVLGEAFEATNLHTHVFRSENRGRTWQHLGPIYAGDPNRLTSDCARLTALPDGQLVAFMVRHDRSNHPDHGLTNPDTLGFVPTELLLLRSADGGLHWTDPEPIDPPLTGPSFELCCPVTVLRDGRWLIPTQTWPGWNGDCPNGIRMGALVSHDNGDSWPEFTDVMREPGRKVYFWESKIVELPDSRLLAVAWAYDDETRRDRPNQFAVSSDGAKTWTAPKSTGLHGQTMTPFPLAHNRLLCVYRRIDTPGLWAALARVDEQDWHVTGQIPLWGQRSAGLTAATDNMAHNFNVLRFGAPCITRLDDRNLFVAFWCYEDCVSVIRWFRLSVETAD
jgi:hypothetical protein